MDNEALVILHADDDEGDRILFEEALGRVPISTRLISLTGGEQLMNYLSAEMEVPNALFLDLNMPKINGFECLAKIKNTQKLQTLPVIICSTSGDERSVQQTFDGGACLYMVKPFDFPLYAKIIHQALVLLSEENFIRPGREKFVLNNNGAL